ncbi:hypothetical protein D9615_006208 [Tricholomella constricta]|uniref:Uncharacterized protein n=1 Tax=Tricholomella constricta TaxID=117010 RepID=A0A8H5HB52_9AGAR|nr:hypothetical protein D9615_006208 [Tricholomella constricta]
MFSTIGTTSSRHGQGFGKSYAPQVPKGFTVRVLKGPALSSFPHTAAAKFDHGYHSVPSAEPRQSHNWYPSRSQTTSNSTPAPGEPPKPSRYQTTDNFASTINHQVGGYDSNSRTMAPAYSIYQNSTDTYIYEPSLSSKSDLYSNSEYDDVSIAAFTPSSAFSPAMSTDSITTRGAITPDISLTDLRPTTPTSSRNSFAMLAQAQSAIRGIFRSQTPHEAHSSRTDNSYVPHASARSTPLPVSSAAGRSTTPVRLSTTPSGSADRSTTHDTYSTTSSIEHSSQPYTRVRSPISESEHSELDRVARANAEYNAASSAPSSAYYSTHDSVNFSTTSSGAANTVGDASRRIYPDIPLRSSPEQQHAYAHNASSYQADSGYERPSSYYTTTDTASRVVGTTNRTSSYPYAPSDSETTATTQSEKVIPPSAEWIESRERRQAPVRRLSEEHSAPQVPLFRNEGPTSSRYVAASRTMLPHIQPATLATASSEAAEATREDGRRQERPLPAPLYPTSQPSGGPRERRASLSQSRAFPTATTTIYAPPEGNRAPPNPPSARETEPRRRSSLEQESSYPVRDSGLPESQEYLATGETDDRSSNARPLPPHTLPSSLRTSPEQPHRPPTTHYVAPQVQDYIPAPSTERTASNYVRATATQQTGTPAAQMLSRRTSPEQMHQLPSTDHVPPQAQDYITAPSSGSGALNHVSATATATRRTSRATAQAPPRRTSPEQSHRLPSTDHVPSQAQDFIPAPVSGGAASNYVSATVTRQTSTDTAQAPPRRTSSEQSHRLPSTDHVPTQAHDYAPPPSSGGAATNYVSATVTRQTSRTAAQMPRRMSPEQTYRLPSTNHGLQAQDFIPAPSSGDAASNYVSTTVTRQTSTAAAQVPSRRTSPEQMHRFPSTHHVAPQTHNYAPTPSAGGAASIYSSATSTRQRSTSTTRAPSLRTSPEQMYRQSTHHVPPAQDYAVIPSSGVAESNNVSSTSSRQANAPPPRTRQNSIVSPIRSLPDSYTTTHAIETSSTSWPQQDSPNSPPRGYSNGHESRQPSSGTRNSPPRNQQTGYAPPQESHIHRSDGSSDRTFQNPDGSSAAISHPVYPSLPIPTSTTQRYAAAYEAPRARYDSEQRSFQSIPDQQALEPSFLSLDPGPARDHRQQSYLKQERAGEGGASHLQNASAATTPALPTSSTSVRFDRPSTFPETDASRSHTPFPEPCRPPAGPQRRYSDGDQSITSNSAYPPALASHSDPDAGASTSAVPAEPQPQPQRRYSDGDQVGSSSVPQRTSLALFRTVRWNETLVCPSPIFAHQRRKGWFNRRGDQLWTNEGAYKPPLPGQEYPPELDDYPEHGEGWMNEESVRIDMGHRLIPKAPLKSALKQPRSQHIQLEI